MKLDEDLPDSLERMRESSLEDFEFRTLYVDFQHVDPAASP